MKTATNISQTITYATITSLENPDTKIAVDEDGNKYSVPLTAMVGDVLVFPTDTSKPIYMVMDDFKVGRNL
jgi:hypothetical protein